MVKDERYKTVKQVIDKGIVTELNEIFRYIPKSVVANDLGTNYNRLSKLTLQIEQFKLQELFRISSFIEIEEQQILNLAYQQYKSLKEKRKK